MGKKIDLSDLERAMIAGAGQVSLTISEIAALLAISHTITSCVYREWSK